MKMGYELVLEQQQKLVMTPELRLALKILQMPQFELEEMVQQEIESNPVLELSDNANNNDMKEESENQDMVEPILDKKNEEKESDVDWREYLSYRGKSYQAEGLSDENSELSYDNLITYNSSLRDHLIAQLQVIKMDKEISDICEFLIESLDENGYLTVNLEEVSLMTSTSIDLVERALKVIQGFEPAGVGARNLKECLLIQLKSMDNEDCRLKIIIEENLEDIGANRIGLIAKKLRLNAIDTQSLCDCIKNLEPKPGRSFENADATRYIVPDVIVEKIGGEYIVFVNDSYSTRLSVSSYYKNVLEHESKESQASQYISRKLSSAMWMIKSIEHRRNTLFNVVSSIMEYQKDFLEDGIIFMKSMTLKNISEEIGVHESTVSRAISGKYVQTPRGTFELKFFFKSGVDNDEGDTISSESVKKKIEKLISEEDHGHPISDQEISEFLFNDGVHISRRTVAKYRDEIGIPSSSKRKRY